MTLLVAIKLVLIQPLRALSEPAVCGQSELGSFPMVLYADGPTAEASIEVDASPEAVWELISDPGFPASVSSELQEASWVGAEEGGLGVTIFGRNRHEAIGEWTTESLVVEWVPLSHWSWMIGDAPHQAAQWWFEMTEQENGSLLVTQRVRIGPGDSGLTPAIKAMPDKEERIVAGRMKFHEANMLANLETLKSRLEDPQGMGSV